MAINTQGYSGLIKKSAVVKSNDPTHAQQMIELEVNVTSVFTTSPKNSFIIETRVGQAAQAILECINNLPNPVYVNQVSHSFGENAEVKYEVIEEGRKYKVSLTAKAKEILRWSGRVFLHLENAPVAKYSIRGYISVRE